MAEITELYPDEPSDIDLEEMPALDLEGMHASCLACGADFRNSTLYRRLRICPRCRFHYSISARRHIAALADEGTFKETSRWIQSLDPLEFSPRVSYRVRLLQDQSRTGLTEAAVTGTCSIGGIPVVIIVLDFGFLGGSMGLVVGEKVALALELAARKKLPAVSVVTSGGSRIQEGVLSLTQMAKTVMATRELRSKGQPLISVLGNPSTGQVLASFASMADIIFAEPGAHVGFAPLKALQQVEDEEAVDKRYNAEAYYRHGHIDRIVDREDLKHDLASILDLISPEFKLAASRRVRPQLPRVTPGEPWEMVKLARRPDRPSSRFYIEKVFANFIELHGDRAYSDDPTVIIGLARLGGESVMVIGQQKHESHQLFPESDEERSYRVRGNVTPGGFRKARRAIILAETFKIPIIVFVDSPGPRLGVDMENRGIASAIARMIDAMSGTKVPTISVLIGEGGSEAALSFSVADRVLMLQNAIYTPIAPEEGAETELRDSNRAGEVARALRLTSVDCAEMGIIDSIVPEPPQGAHASPDQAALLLKRTLMRELIDLRDVHSRTLVRRRRKKFRKIGEYGSRFRIALRREIKIWQSGLAAGVRALRGKNEEDLPESEEEDEED